MILSILLNLFSFSLYLHNAVVPWAPCQVLLHSHSSYWWRWSNKESRIYDDIGKTIRFCRDFVCYFSSCDSYFRGSCAFSLELSVCVCKCERSYKRLSRIVHVRIGRLRFGRGNDAETVWKRQKSEFVTDRPTQWGDSRVFIDIFRWIILLVSSFAMVLRPKSNLAK